MDKEQRKVYSVELRENHGPFPRFLFEETTTMHVASTAELAIAWAVRNADMLTEVEKITRVFVVCEDVVDGELLDTHVVRYIGEDGRDADTCPEYFSCGPVGA